MESNRVPPAPSPIPSPIPSPVSSAERRAHLLRVLKSEADKGDLKYKLQYGRQLLQSPTSSSADFNEGLTYVFRAAEKRYQPAVDYLLDFSNGLFKSAVAPIEKKHSILDHLLELDLSGLEASHDYLSRNCELLFEVGRATFDSPTEVVFKKRKMGLHFIGISATLGFDPASDFIVHFQEKMAASALSQSPFGTIMSKVFAILASGSDRLPTPGVELENVQIRELLNHAQEYGFWFPGRLLLSSALNRMDSGESFGRLGYESLRVLSGFLQIKFALTDFVNTLNFQGHRIFSSPELNHQEREDILRLLFKQLKIGDLEAVTAFDQIFYLESKKPIEQQDWSLLRRIEDEIRSYFNPLCKSKDVNACFVLGIFDLYNSQFKQAEEHLRFGINQSHGSSFLVYVGQVALERPFFSKTKLIAHRGDFINVAKGIQEFNALINSPIAFNGLRQALALTQDAEKSGNSGIERGLDACSRAEGFYKQILLCKPFKSPELDAKYLEAERQFTEIMRIKLILSSRQEREIETKAAQEMERRARLAERLEGEREREKEREKAAEKVAQLQIQSRERHSSSGVSAELFGPKYSWRLLIELTPADVNAQFPLDTLPPFPADEEESWTLAFKEAGSETSPFSKEERSNIRKVSWSFEDRFLVRYLFAIKNESEAVWNVHDFESRLYRYLADRVKGGIIRASVMAGAGAGFSRTPSPKERAPTPEEGGAGVTREWNVQISEELSDYLNQLMDSPVADNLILLKKLRKTLTDLKVNPYLSGLNSHKLESTSLPIFESYLENHSRGARRVFWVKSKDESHCIVVLLVREHLKESECIDAIFTRFFDFYRPKPSVEIPDRFWVDEERS